MHFEFSVSFRIRLQDWRHPLHSFIHRLNCIVFVIFSFQFLLFSHSLYEIRIHDGMKNINLFLITLRVIIRINVMPTTRFFSSFFLSYEEAQKLICGFTLSWSHYENIDIIIWREIIETGEHINIGYLCEKNVKKFWRL